MGRGQWRRRLPAPRECMLPCGTRCVQGKGHPRYPDVGRAVMSARELLQWEHTAEYRPGIVSKRDKFRPNLLQNNPPIKHTQSVLIHP